jgi:hypothetical protein
MVLRAPTASPLRSHAEASLPSSPAVDPSRVRSFDSFDAALSYLLSLPFYVNSTLEAAPNSAAFHVISQPIIENKAFIVALGAVSAAIAVGGTLALLLGSRV